MSDLVEGCSAAWNRMAMERELAEASKKLVAQSTEIARLQAALHRISLGSQNSGTTKEDLGREARAALKEKTDV